MNRYSKAIKALMIGLVVAGLLAVPLTPAHAAGGALDSRFGRGGTVHTDLGAAYGEVTALVVQPDDKILVFGRGATYLLARYNPDGSMDTSFGQRGSVAVFPDVQTNITDPGVLALQKDGKIVVAATVQDGRIGQYIALARYTRNGTLDTSFGAGGRTGLTPPSNSYGLSAGGIVVQPDGRIVIAGKYGSYTGSGSVTVIRFKTNGQLDASFGMQGGMTSTEYTPGGGDEATGVALQPDGCIVVVAQLGQVGSGGEHWGVLRYTAGGQLDASFGDEGIALINFNEANATPQGVQITRDGKIVVAGQVQNYPCTSNSCVRRDFAVVQYTGDGELDTRFGDGGGTITSFGGGPTQAAGLVRLGDGRIIAAGVSSGNIAVAAYTARGGAERTFGSAGSKSISLGGDTRINALGVQSNGRIILAGALSGDFLLVGLQSR